MKKSIFGVTDSMSRFTGSLGKGLSAATMDKKFQEKRRMNMTRNKPTHAIYGITQGVGYFGTSIASGVAGLVVSYFDVWLPFIYTDHHFRNVQLKELKRMVCWDLLKVLVEAS